MRKLKTKRGGVIARPLLMFAFSIGGVFLLLGAILALRWDSTGRDQEARTLRVYCAAGVVRPLQKVIDDFNQQFSTNVVIARTAGSGELAGQIQAEHETGMSDGGQVFVSADAALMSRAESVGAVSHRFSIAAQRPVVAVLFEDESKIQSFREMVTREGIRFAIASEQAAVGRIARKIARAESLSKLLEQNKTTETENVMTLAQALVTGALDAAVIWDTTVEQINANMDRPVIKVACLADESETIQSNIEIGVMASAPADGLALQFAKFAASAETGKKHFEAYGFDFAVKARSSTRSSTAPKSD